MKKILLTLMLSVLTFSVLSAQSKAFIVYAEGKGFSINRNGVEKEYSIQDDNIYSIEFQEKDIILTQSSSFIEIQLVPSQTLIKISENTTVSISSLTNEGGGYFEVVYGKIKAKVDKISGKEGFSVYSSTTVAGVRGTEFGFDVGISPTDFTTQSSVYCFSGEVYVSMKTEDTQSGKNPQITVKAGQMVVRNKNTAVQPKEVVPITDEVKNYWNNFEFKTQAKEVWTFPGYEDLTPAITETKPANNNSQRPDYLLSGILSGTGLLALGGGLLYQGFSPDPGQNDGSMLMYALGGALVLAGCGSLIDQLLK